MTDYGLRFDSLIAYRNNSPCCQPWLCIYQQNIGGQCYTTTWWYCNILLCDRDSSILAWIHDYIARGGDHIQLYYLPNDDSNINEVNRGSATARLLSYRIENETGFIILESQINITVQAYYPASPLTCLNSNGYNDSIELHVSRKFSMAVPGISF